jgi:glutathione S-transferase
MKLYVHPLSGHSHRARLLTSLLGIEHELIEVDLAAGAQKCPEFLIEALPGFVEFAKTPVGLAAAA